MSLAEFVGGTVKLETRGLSFIDPASSIQHPASSMAGVRPSLRDGARDPARRIFTPSA
jgi:hypothetical protein